MASTVLCFRRNPNCLFVNNKLCSKKALQLIIHNSSKNFNPSNKQRYWSIIVFILLIAILMQRNNFGFCSNSGKIPLTKDRLIRYVKYGTVTSELNFTATLLLLSSPEKGLLSKSSIVFCASLSDVG